MTWPTLVRRATIIATLGMASIMGSTPGALGAPAAPAAPSVEQAVAPAATYTLVQSVPAFGRTVNLWRNNTTSQLHGHIANAVPGDSVWLEGTGCPNGACGFTTVRPGQTHANTIAVTGVVDACGSPVNSSAYRCTCILCFQDAHATPARPAATPAPNRTTTGSRNTT